MTQTVACSLALLNRIRSDNEAVSVAVVVRTAATILHDRIFTSTNKYCSLFSEYVVVLKQKDGIGADETTRQETLAPLYDHLDGTIGLSPYHQVITKALQ